jgi:serine/threonine protein kinase
VSGPLGVCIIAAGAIGAVPMNKLRDLAAGAVLGRYELILRVASGGMGEVWAARIKGTRGFQKVVALKTLLPELSHNPNFEQMFLDEAALASRLRHPNVVQVIDLGEESQVLFQVMEWVSGESLWGIMRAAAKRGGVPLDVAARIICQVCAGLHAAHELKNEFGESIGLVHRDVSPQNILLTAQGIAKVVDFGVAKFAGRGVAATQVGELRGKVPYMAPEHIRGQELDRRADVFALGLLFYQLVSGEHPFLSDNDQLTMSRISSATAAPLLHTRARGVPEEISAVVAAALEKMPAARTKTALELMHQIERILPDAGLQSSNDRVAEYLKEIVGQNIELREDELRDALRRLEGRSSIPPSVRTQPLREGEERPSFPPEPPPVRIVVEPPSPSLLVDSAHGTPPLGTPPAFYSTARRDEDIGESDTMLPPETGWRAYFGRPVRLALAGVVVVIAGVVIGLSTGGSAPEDPTASPASSGESAPQGKGAPQIALTAAGIAAPIPNPSSSAAATARPADSAVPAGLVTASQSGAAAPTWRGAPAGPGPSKPPPQKGKAPTREYTPGGL